MLTGRLWRTWTLTPAIPLKIPPLSHILLCLVRRVWISAMRVENKVFEDLVDNLNTTQTPECTKEKYNAEMEMKGSLLRSHQQPM
jgi:hypothetical protein